MAQEMEVSGLIGLLLVSVVLVASRVEKSAMHCLCHLASRYDYLLLQVEILSYLQYVTSIDGL